MDSIFGRNIDLYSTMNNTYLPQRQRGLKASRCISANQIQSLTENRMNTNTKPGL